MSEREGNTMTILGAFVLGGLVGAGIALLTVPRSGRETREEIGRWAGDAAEKARTKVKELYGSAREKLSRHGVPDTDQA